MNDRVNVAELLWDRVREAPDMYALTDVDGTDFSYARLGARAEEFAVYCLHAGVNRGDRILFISPNSADYVAFLFGCWTIGAVPCTINSSLGQDELIRVCRELEPRFVATLDQGLWNRVRTAAVEVGSANALLPQGSNDMEGSGRNRAAVAVVACDSGDEASIMQTGGSTGSPKLVAQSHGGVMSNLARLAKGLGAGSPNSQADTAASAHRLPNLVPFPLCHGLGQWSVLFALFVGRPVVLMSRFHVDKYVELIHTYRPTNLLLLQTMLYDLVHFDGEADLSSVKTVSVQGGLDETLRAQFERRFNIPIITGYGATEFGHIAGWSREDIRAGKWKPGSAGLLYDGVQLEVRDADSHEPVPRGTVGELFVRTTSSGQYASSGGASPSARIADDQGWIATGDIGYLDGDDVLFIVGRVRRMIKCGGFQVLPPELEETLRTHPDVDDCVVVGVPDSRLGEVPFAYLVSSTASNEGGDAELLQGILEWCRDRLAHYKVPRDGQFISSIPRNEIGKVDPSQLPTPEGLLTSGRSGG